MRRNLVVWLILLLVGFLLGFIPQYRHARELQSEIASSRQQLASSEIKEQLCAIRDAAALAYLEVTRKNYGTAADYSSRMFNQVQQVSGSTSDNNLKSALGRVAARRDAVTTALANADAAAAADLQSILVDLEQNAKL